MEDMLAVLWCNHVFVMSKTNKWARQRWKKELEQNVRKKGRSKGKGHHLLYPTSVLTAVICFMAVNESNMSRTVPTHVKALNSASAATFPE